MSRDCVVKFTLPQSFKYVTARQTKKDGPFTYSEPKLIDGADKVKMQSGQSAYILRSGRQVMTLVENQCQFTWDSQENTLIEFVDYIERNGRNDTSRNKTPRIEGLNPLLTARLNQ